MVGFSLRSFNGACYSLAMKAKSLDLRGITETTLGHYNNRAEDFWRGTKDHDVTQNIEALLRHIAGDPAVTMPLHRHAGARRRREPGVTALVTR